MRLSTRSRYGTRLVLELAIKFDRGPVYLKDISSAQNLSLKYLSQLIIPLKAAGLVKAMRGAHGGYFLAKRPEEIRLIEVVEALEGPLKILECIENPSFCKRYENCVTRLYWKKINTDIYNSLYCITFGDMIKSFNEINAEKSILT